MKEAGGRGVRWSNLYLLPSSPDAEKNRGWYCMAIPQRGRASGQRRPFPFVGAIRMLGVDHQPLAANILARKAARSSDVMGRGWAKSSR